MRSSFFLAAVMLSLASALAVPKTAWADADQFHRQYLAACEAGDPQTVALCSHIEDRFHKMGINGFSGTYNLKKAAYNRAVRARASQHIPEVQNAPKTEQQNQVVPGVTQWQLIIHSFVPRDHQVVVPMASDPLAATDFAVGDAQCTLGPSEEQPETEKDGHISIYVTRVLVCTNAIVRIPTGDSSALVCYRSPDGRNVGLKQSSFALEDATGKQIASGSATCRFLQK